MKTTKKIKALAEKIAKDDEYTSIEYAEQTLNDLKRALLTGRYYTRVNTVSKSGMSRTISISWIENNKLVRAPRFVMKLAGCDCNDRISGCGMDMLFAAQYNLYCSLTDRKRQPYQSHMKQYNRYN